MLPRVGIAITYSTQLCRTFPCGPSTAELDGLVTRQAFAFRHQLTTDYTIGRIVCLSRVTKNRPLSVCAQLLIRGIIRVTLIYDNTAAFGKGQRTSYNDVMRFTLGHRHKLWYITIMVQADMQFYRALSRSESGPGKNR